MDINQCAYPSKFTRNLFPIVYFFSFFLLLDQPPWPHSLLIIG